MTDQHLKNGTNKKIVNFSENHKIISNLSVIKIGLSLKKTICSENFYKINKSLEQKRLKVAVLLFTEKLMKKKLYLFPALIVGQTHQEGWNRR